MNEQSPLLRNGRQPIQDPYEALLNDVTLFNNEVSKLYKMTDLLGTSRDSEQLRNQLRHQREECASHARDIVQHMKRAPTTRTEKPKYDKLMSQFNEIFNRCQTISKESIQKERMTEVPHTAAVEASPWEAQAGAGGQSRGQFSREQDANRQMKAGLQKLEYESLHVEREIIEERDREIQHLEKELRGLNDIFVDVAVMIKEQGEMIDTIEQHTEQAVNSTTEGVSELKKASEYQRSSRKKLCCLLLLLVIILAVIVIVILFSIKVIKV